jgi:hypothetical protein
LVSNPAIAKETHRVRGLAGAELRGCAEFLGEVFQLLEFNAGGSGDAAHAVHAGLKITSGLDRGRAKRHQRRSHEHAEVFPQRLGGFANLFPVLSHPVCASGRSGLSAAQTGVVL